MNPIKPKLKTEIIPIAFLLLAAIASLYFYSRFPEQVPIHWNYKGEADNYGSKMFASFFFPALAFCMYLLFLFLPYLDPKKEKYEQFQKVYHIFKAAIVAMLSLLYLVSSFHVLGQGPSPHIFVPPMIGILFIVIGNYLPKIKTNWFMGIRTPWTLSSETVWQKTHQVGGRLFVVAGLVFLLIPIVSNEKARMALFFASILTVVFGTVAYSFFAYKQEQKK